MYLTSANTDLPSRDQIQGMLTAPDRMVFTLLRIHRSVMCSTLVSMGKDLQQDVLKDYISLRIWELVFGPGNQEEMAVSPLMREEKRSKTQTLVRRPPQPSLRVYQMVSAALEAHWGFIQPYPTPHPVDSIIFA
jgi:hypothetical protein